MIKISSQSMSSINGQIKGINTYIDAICKELDKEYQSPQYIREKTDAIKSCLGSIEGIMEYENGR